MKTNYVSAIVNADVVTVMRILNNYNNYNIFST